MHLDAKPSDGDHVGVAASETVLQVRDLSVDFKSEQGSVRAVDRVSFDLHVGRTLALVGESGSGKTATAMAMMGLLPSNGSTAGEVLLKGEDLLALLARRLQRIRGRHVAMIFQEPMTSLNPVMSVGQQIVEAVELHTSLRGEAAWRRAVEMMERVGIIAADRRVHAYPHELSGGMRQRIMIAMALVCGPSVLIADEPTTALDVTVQAQVLELLRAIQAQTGLSILLITHDLAVVAQVAHEVAVMYAGRIVEQAPVHALFRRPAHPYTRALLDCLPRMGSHRRRLASIEGTVPSLTEMPPGCRFEPRCTIGRGDPQCGAESPPGIVVGTDHSAACWKTDA